MNKSSNKRAVLESDLSKGELNDKISYAQAIVTNSQNTLIVRSKNKIELNTRTKTHVVKNVYPVDTELNTYR